MDRPKKKQFSLGVIMRIFLGVMIVVSLGVFANSIMYYNELNREAEALQQALSGLRETRAELEHLLGSAENVNRMLADYDACLAVLNSGTQEGEILQAYRERLEEIRALLQNSENRDYIAKIAKDELGLYFADEEIFYHDTNR